MSEKEKVRYQELLLRLRRLNGDSPQATDESSAPSPWRFGRGEAITIVTSRLPERYRAGLPYSNPHHPDYLGKSYEYGDLDALLELVRAVSQLNPDNPLQWGLASRLSPDDRTAHLIVLGGADFNDLSRDILKYLSDIPVAQSERKNEDDEGAFSVLTPTGFEEFRPVLADGLLTEDVAHFLRAPNPYNRKRTLTLCSGMFARGSFAIVRALTDPEIKNRNAAYLANRFPGCDSYSILCRVKVVANEIVVPDWTSDEFRLYEWPEAVE
jgi:hypothetical protein